MKSYAVLIEECGQKEFKMKSSIVFAIILSASAAFAQTHIPSALPPEGQMSTFLGEIVPFDVEIVHITPSPVYLIEGWPLDSSHNAFRSTNNVVRLLLAYDVTYTVQMQGRADDPDNPARAEATETITLTATEDQKVSHYLRQLVVAMEFLMSKDRTFRELADANNAPAN